MDAARRNNDCYFYYYSTCLKGDGCRFRHEPSALGCETVCTYWQQGKCLNQHCNFRHMELKKNRKLIPCYWENQPGGCRKPHCPFMHEKPRDSVGTILEKSNKEASGEGNAGYNNGDRLGGGAAAAGNDTEATSLNAAHGHRPVNSLPQQPQAGIGNDNVAGYGSPPVDPLVVNFEEESDNESVPTTTPTKKPLRKVHVKTLEEIRLERIQAESAAFYGYSEDDGGGMESEIADLRAKIPRRTEIYAEPPSFRVLTLEEIRRSRRAVMLKHETVSANKGSSEVQPKRVADFQSNSVPPKKLKRKPPPRAPPDVITETGVVKLRRHRYSALPQSAYVQLTDNITKEQLKPNGVICEVSQNNGDEHSVVKETTAEEEDELLVSDDEMGGVGTVTEMSTDEDVLEDIDALL